LIEVAIEKSEDGSVSVRGESVAKSSSLRRFDQQNHNTLIAFDGVRDFDIGDADI
jgi:hypothetical protein